MEVDHPESVTSACSGLFESPSGFSLIGGSGGAKGGLLSEPIEKMLEALDRKRFAQVMQARRQGGAGALCPWSARRKCSCPRTGLGSESDLAAPAPRPAPQASARLDAMLTEDAEAAIEPEAPGRRPEGELWVRVGAVAGK